MSRMKSSQSFSDDYQTLTAGSGFVELKNWSTVTMTGEDRHSFLHNMCTNDIKRLSVGESCEAFCTDVKGKIVIHAFVIAREDRLELLAVPEQAETLIAHLDRYIIREDVTLTDATDDLIWRFVGGGETISDSIKLGDAPPNDDSDGVACSYETWEAFRIEAGLPLFGIDFDNSHLPQEINRDKLAISFNKGCYLGQETIARIDALGHVNQKVVQIKFATETVPPVGLELGVAGKSVGQVTSSCWSPQHDAPLALARVRRGSNEVGNELESTLGVAAVITPGATSC